MKIGCLGTIDGMRKSKVSVLPSKKSFSLSYDLNSLKLYSSAKIIIDGKTFSTDKALWDTGASITAISSSAASQIDAVATDNGTAISATDRSDCDIYLGTSWWNHFSEC